MKRISQAEFKLNAKTWLEEFKKNCFDLRKRKPIFGFHEKRSDILGFPKET